MSVLSVCFRPLTYRPVDFYNFPKFPLFLVVLNRFFVIFKTFRKLEQTTFARNVVRKLLVTSKSLFPSRHIPVITHFRWEFA
uniref:Uncharacterized protein n=1 Tax=Bursaphelenchus xylophilus TaxID=6326 RepID=A0A1I7RLQ1_BURXY